MSHLLRDRCRRSAVGRVGDGLVLAWFESYVPRLDSSLQSPGQEKHFGILFIPLRVVVREYVCRDDNGGNGHPSMHGFRLFCFVHCLAI